MRGSSLPVAALAAVLAALAMPAMAHAPLAGAAGFAAATPHVLTEPPQALLILALCLWSGQVSGRRQEVVDFITIPAALVAGAAIGFFVWGSIASLIPSFLVPSSLVFACLLGLASGAQFTLPRPWARGLQFAAALPAGMFCTPDPGPPGAMLVTAAGALLGACVGSIVIFLLARWCASPSRPAAFGIALRVAGSWIAAASMMAGALAVTQM